MGGIARRAADERFPRTETPFDPEASMYGVDYPRRIGTVTPGAVQGDTQAQLACAIDQADGEPETEPPTTA